jgi:uncharacterized SAM-binding protein YcdF (DUF218 family)
MRIIDDITDFIFINDTPREADIIFIPGGSYPEPAEKAAQLFCERCAPWVLPSGKYGITLGRFAGVKSKAEIYSGVYSTECDFYTDVLIKNDVPLAAVLKECDATFTRENADFSRALTDRKGLAIRRAILCCKNWHARRALMYYQMAFPDTEFYVAATEKTGGINRDNWFLTEKDTAQVLSELAKCGGQMVTELKEYLRKPD